jgi:hypothetical protein
MLIRQLQSSTDLKHVLGSSLDAELKNILNSLMLFASNQLVDFNKTASNPL